MAILLFSCIVVNKLVAHISMMPGALIIVFNRGG